MILELNLKFYILAIFICCLRINIIILNFVARCKLVNLTKVVFFYILDQSVFFLLRLVPVLEQSLLTAQSNRTSTRRTSILISRRDRMFTFQIQPFWTKFLLSSPYLVLLPWAHKLLAFS